MNKTAIQTAIELLQSQMSNLSENDTRARSTIRKSIELLASMLATEREQIEAAYRAGRTEFSYANIENMKTPPIGSRTGTHYFNETYPRIEKSDHSVRTNDMVQSDEEYVKSVYPDARYGIWRRKYYIVQFGEILSDEFNGIKLAWQDAAKRIRSNKK